MTIASATNRVSYTGNGSVDTYAYTFRIFDEDDLTVTVRDTATTPIETTLTKTTDYTVTGVGANSGGNVVLVNSAQAWLDADGDLKTGYTIVIRRVRDILQDFDIRNQGDFYPEGHEDALDSVIMIAQQQQDEIDRSIKLPETEDPAGFDTALPTDLVGEVNVVLMTNDAGDGFEAGPSASQIELAQGYSVAAAASAAAALVSEGNAEDWAKKTDGIVEATDYSSKAWAIGGTGVTDTASKGAAKEWAIETASTVDGTSFSAKEHAIGTQASTGGSSKDWAIKTDAIVDSVDYSSKEYAQGVQSSTGGSAKSWAQETATDVDGVDYSSKEYAIGTQTRGQAGGGSAKDWATYIDGENTVDDSEKSAKYYATVAYYQAHTMLGIEVQSKVFADSPITMTGVERGYILGVDCTNGNVVITLPSIGDLDITIPFTVCIKKTDSTANTVTVNRASTDTIDGDTSLSFGVQFAGVIFFAETSPSNFWSIIKFGPPSSVASLGGTASIDTLQQKQENEKYSVFTKPLDYSVGESGAFEPYIDTIKGSLIKQYTASDATIGVVWNPVVMKLSQPDTQNTNITTGWGAGTRGANSNTLGNVGTPQVGAYTLSWNKTAAGAISGVKYDRGAQDLGVGGNTRLWFWVYLPAASDIKNVYVSIFADAVGNYRTWTTTTDYSGAALTLNAWNLIFVDVSTGGTATGTGWTSSQLSRYQEFGVETNTAGTTITALAVNGIYFSMSEPEKLGLLGQELTIFDTTNSNSIILATSNTSYDGILTLDATIADTFVGGAHTGTSNPVAARAFVKRSGTYTDRGVIGFESTNATAGEITTSQVKRVSNAFKASATKNYSAFVDMVASQKYVVDSLGVGTAIVDSPVDDSANMKNGDTVDIFRPHYHDGKVTYEHIRSEAMTADSTYGSSQLTLTVDVTGPDVLAGDIICKRHVSSLSLSTVSTGAKEVFSALSLDASPDGIQLIGGATLPQIDKIIGHYALGADTQANAILNRRGSLPNFGVTGSPPFGGTFLGGRLAGGPGLNDTNHFQMSDANAHPVNADDGNVAVSFWVYLAASDSNLSYILAKSDFATTGFYIAQNDAAGTNKLQLFQNGPVDSVLSYTANSWNHVVLERITGDTNMYLWLNGVREVVVTGGGAPDNDTNTFDVCDDATSQSTTKVADLIIWKNHTLFTSGEISSLYNGGNYQDTLALSNIRYRYTALSKSGQKASLKLVLARTTTAITPSSTGLGAI